MVEEYPFNLPIWRRSYRAVSPNGRIVAEIDPANEVSMGNPTMGTLQISCGITLQNCNPSFIWSDDSRYLVVPRYFYWGLVFRRQRILIIDVDNKMAFASRKHTWYFQPKSFSCGRLVVTVEPFHSTKDIMWDIPADLNEFKSTVVTSSKSPPIKGVDSIG